MTQYSATASRGRYEVDTATSVHQARAQANANWPDFVVLDLRLGQETGFDLLPFFQRRTPQPYVVMLSAYANVASAVPVVGQRQGAVNI